MYYHRKIRFYLDESIQIVEKQTKINKAQVPRGEIYKWEIEKSSLSLMCAIQNSRRITFQFLRHKRKQGREQTSSGINYTIAHFGFT